jgi:class 3 adenylate cyclase
VLADDADAEETFYGSGGGGGGGGGGSTYRGHLRPHGFRSVFVVVYFCVGHLFATLLHEVSSRSSFNLWLRNKIQKRKLLQQEGQIDRLLQLRIPPRIIARLKDGERDIADPYDNVTVLQSDVVGFTAFSSTVNPQQLRHFITQMLDLFTAIVEDHGLYLVEIIGDAMLVVSGIPMLKNGNANGGDGGDGGNGDGADATAMASHDMDALHAYRACAAALEFNQALEDLAAELPALIGTGKNASAAKAARSLRIRLGLHSGKVVAGVVGMKDPRYHLFGDTVQIAQSMESQGEPGRVHCTQETALLAAAHDQNHHTVTTPVPDTNGEFRGQSFEFKPRPGEDLRASAKYDGTYLKQTYFVDAPGSVSAF